MSIPNWTGLLGWSTTYHDGTSASQLGPMDEDRKKWLVTALDSAFGGQEDPMKVMIKAVEEISEGRVSAGLDLLDYTSDFLDCAENFGKVGALEAVINLLKSENPDIVLRALGILTAYFPNNPRLQLEAALKQNCLEHVKMVMNSHSKNSVMVVAAVSVIGSIIRNVTVLEASFIRDGGIELLANMLFTVSNGRLALKIVSLFTFLASRHNLSDKASIFSATIQHIYTTNLAEPTDIQFWESMANFVNVVGISEQTMECISTRESWISSLNGDNKEEHTEEHKILLEIVSRKTDRA